MMSLKFYIVFLVLFLNLYNYILFFPMKNSLQLQIALLIKKANVLYMENNLSQSILAYDKALQTFKQNKSYNYIVNPYFEGLIYSLKGQACSQLKQYEQALNCFDQSILINPHDFLTLSRRSKLFCQLNRIGEAIQDAQNTYICDPKGFYIQQLISQIGIAIQKMEDINQKERLKKNLQSISCVNQEQQTQIEEQVLSFSHLKQIDRGSFSSFCKEKDFNRSKNKKTSFFKANSTQQEYQQNLQLNNDDIVQNLNQNQPRQDPVIIHKVGSVTKKPGRKYNKFLSINLSQEKSNQSMKSIDKKLQNRNSVRFIQNSNNICCSGNISEVNLLSSEDTKRKSCLRSSKLATKQIQNLICQNGRRSSSFMQIKNIDGTYIPSSITNLNSKQNQASQISTNKQDFLNKQQACQSDDQNENTEHNIYGQKYRTSKILKCIENLGWSGRNIQANHGKKGSILKKNSVIGSQKDNSHLGTLDNRKKSVCFIDEHS